MKLPKNDFVVKIGALDFDVKWCDDVATQKQVFGTCDCNTQTIFLQKGDNAFTLKKQKKEQTFLHEVLHALYWERGLYEIDDPTEEQIVSILSMGLYLFLKDNKDIL